MDFKAFTQTQNDINVVVLNLLYLLIDRSCASSEQFRAILMCLCLKAQSSIWTHSATSALQWTLVTRADPSFQTTWRSCSVPWPWWCRITPWLLRFLCIHLVFLKPRHCLWRLWPCTDCVRSSCPHSFTMTMVWEPWRQCYLPLEIWNWNTQTRRRTFWYVETLDVRLTAAMNSEPTQELHRF